MRANSSATTEDIVYGSVVGLLASGIKPILVGLTMLFTLGKSFWPAHDAWEAPPFVVWSVLACPIITYLSVSASFGASSAWSQTQTRFGMLSRPEISAYLRPLDDSVPSLFQVTVRGAVGGVAGVAFSAPLLGVGLLLSLIVSIFGPGWRMPVLALAVIVLLIVFAAIIGGLLGALIYLRRKSTVAGLFCAGIAIMLSNLAINHSVSIRHTWW